MEQHVNTKRMDDDCFGVIYPAILDEIDPLDDGEVRIVNAPFDMSKVICTTEPDGSGGVNFTFTL